MKKQVMWCLGVAGLLPFFAAAVAHRLSMDLAGIKALLIFQAYSAVILAFLAGTLWGRSLSLERGTPTLLLLLSNALALIAFSALLLPETSIAITLLLSGYVMVLLSEHYYRQLLTPSYLKMRSFLTALVVLAHSSVLL